MAARDHLLLALDLDDADRAVALAEECADLVYGFKVGIGRPPGLLHGVLDRGWPVLYDAKLHDIPHTVEHAAREIAALGVWGVTAHALGGPQMIAAARRGLTAGAGRNQTALFAVTMLTSLDAEHWQEVLGWPADPQLAVSHLARLACVAGADGIVASPQEVRAVKAACGAQCRVVTPGIRSPEQLPDDQRRTATPAEAIRAGADYLVIGRIVLQAPEPRAALEQIVAQIETVTASTSLV